MEDRSAVIKLQLFLTFSLRLSSAVPHTLEYNWTVNSLGQFTSVGLLDREEFMYYDIKTANMTPKTEWIKKVESDSSYWERETRDVRFQQDWLMSKLNSISDKTKGGNTLQRVYGCKINDKNVTSGYDKSIYNDNDVISLNLTTGTWTAVDGAQNFTENFTQNWNPGQKSADHWKNFLERKCVDRLQSYKPYSTKKEDPGGSEGGAEEILDIGPEGGSDGQSDKEKTVVTVVVVLVLVLIAAAAGFVIYKKKLCAHLRSGYIGARQKAEL